MNQYLLSIYQPSGGTPPPETLDAITRDLDALNERMKAEGAFVFAGGLQPQEAATVLRSRDEEVVATDGPFAEAKEFLGGFTIVRAPDIDAALAWGRELARATRLPVEVRAFQS